jgi:hypothetical protein
VRVLMATEPQRPRLLSLCSKASLNFFLSLSFTSVVMMLRCLTNLLSVLKILKSMLLISGAEEPAPSGKIFLKISVMVVWKESKVVLESS